jgi:hypothetical protein
MKWVLRYAVYRMIFRSGRPKAQVQGTPTAGDTAFGYGLMFLVFSLPAALFSFAGPVFLAVPFVALDFVLLIATISHIPIRK